MVQFSVWPASCECVASIPSPAVNAQAHITSFSFCLVNGFKFLPFFYIFMLLILLQMVRRIQKMNSPLVWSWWTPVLDHCRNQGYLIHRTIQPVKVSCQKYVLQNPRISCFKTECISFSDFHDYFLILAEGTVVVSRQIASYFFGFVMERISLLAFWGKNKHTEYILRKIFSNCNVAVLYYKVMSQNCCITPVKTTFKLQFFIIQR